MLITLLEVGVGKNLSCWVWDECSTESSSSADPTIFGAVQGVSSSAGTEVAPLNPQQQPDSSAVTPGVPASQGTPDVPGSETLKPSSSPSAQPAQWQGPLEEEVQGALEEVAEEEEEEEEEDQQEIPYSSSVPVDPQQSPADPQQTPAENAESQ